jgi:hypothetical protein
MEEKEHTVPAGDPSPVNDPNPVIVVSGKVSLDALTDVTVERLKQAGSAESAMLAQEYLKT